MSETKIEIGEIANERITKTVDYLVQYFNALVEVQNYLLKKIGYPYNVERVNIEAVKHFREELLKWAKISEDIVSLIQKSDSASVVDVGELLKKLWRVSLYYPHGYALDHYLLVSSINFEVEAQVDKSLLEQFATWIREVMPGAEKSQKAVIRCEGGVILLKFFHDDTYSSMFLLAHGGLDLGPLFMAAAIDFNSWQHVIDKLENILENIRSKLTENLNRK